MGCHSLLQGIFLTQELNPCLLHCRQILYLLSYEGILTTNHTWSSPALKWCASPKPPFISSSSWFTFCKPAVVITLQVDVAWVFGCLSTWWAMVEAPLPQLLRSPCQKDLWTKDSSTPDSVAHLQYWVSHLVYLIKRHLRGHQGSWLSRRNRTQQPRNISGSEKKLCSYQLPTSPGKNQPQHKTQASEMWQVRGSRISAQGLRTGGQHRGRLLGSSLPPGLWERALPRPPTQNQAAQKEFRERPVSLRWESGREWPDHRKPFWKLVSRWVNTNRECTAVPLCWFPVSKKGLEPAHPILPVGLGAAPKLIQELGFLPHPPAARRRQADVRWTLALYPPCLSVALRPPPIQRPQVLAWGLLPHPSIGIGSVPVTPDKATRPN